MKSIRKISPIAVLGLIAVLVISASATVYLLVTKNTNSGTFHIVGADMQFCSDAACTTLINPSFTTTQNIISGNPIVMRETGSVFYINFTTSETIDATHPMKLTVYAITPSVQVNFYLKISNSTSAPTVLVANNTIVNLIANKIAFKLVIDYDGSQIPTYGDSTLSVTWTASKDIV